jgi:hypothetical protein
VHLFYPSISGSAMTRYQSKRGKPGESERATWIQGITRRPNRLKCTPRMYPRAHMPATTRWAYKGLSNHLWVGWSCPSMCRRVIGSQVHSRGAHGGMRQAHIGCSTSINRREWVRKENTLEANTSLLCVVSPLSFSLAEGDPSPPHG